MKYEFIPLKESFKNNPENLYIDDNKNYCLDLTEIFNEHKKIKCPISIFINGIFLEHEYYSFKNNKVTIKNSYPVYPTDRIYIIFTSSNNISSGLISQYALFDYTILDDNTIKLVEPLGLLYNQEVIAVNVNGILYSQEDFSITNEDIIYFNKYRPDNTDDLSILILKK